jgi:signal transduction histidine kinase
MTQGKVHIRYCILAFFVGLLCMACENNDNDTVQPSELATQLGFSHENPLIFGIDHDYAPLEYVDEKGKPQGYDVEFTRILMQRLGIPFTFQPNSWKNIASDVLHGNVDLGMMIYSPYRKDSTNYSRAVFRLYYQVVYPKVSDDERFDFRNLEGKRIAYMNSRPVGEMLTSENAKKFSVTNLEEAMFDLVKGKYDAVICYRYQARYLIRQHHFKNLLTDDISLPPREYCYVGSNKNLINAIDRELLKMEVEGVTDDVYIIKSTFSGIRIPSWVWYLIGGITILALLIINIIYRESRKKLAQANEVLERSNLELKQRNEELVIAREQAMESDRMKTSFIQNMTHQIRTPLNIITGFAQVINDDYEMLSHEEMKMMVGQMMKNTDAITAIVNKLISLSIIQSRYQLKKDDRESCNMLCQEASAALRLSHPDAVTFKIESSVPDNLYIQTKKSSLLNIIGELLHNADYFTEKGSITLSCYQPDDANVCFCVTDTGKGISSKDKQNIFDQFFKADEFTEGLGLGLTLCKITTNQLGGDIRIDENYNTGLRIIVTMPLE